jgi:hypothetical protein
MAGLDPAIHERKGRERSRPFFYFVIPGRAKREL